MSAARTVRSARVQSARRGLQVHRVPSIITKNYVPENHNAKDDLKNALVSLTGVAQDFVAASGYDLSKLLYDDAMRRLGVSWWKPYVIPGLTRCVLGAACVLNKTGWTRSSGAALITLLKNLIPPLAAYINITTIDNLQLVTLMRRIQPGMTNIMARKHTDLRPIVFAVVDALKPANARALAGDYLKNMLNTYVYAAYVPSKEPGVMCRACGAAASSCGKVHPSRNNGSHLARLAQRAIAAMNLLLRVEGRGLTVSSALQTAMRANLTEALAAQLKKVIRYSSPVKPLIPYIASAFFNFFDRRVKPMGLRLDPGSFKALVANHIQTLYRFLSGEKVSIEQFLVALVHAAKPMGIVKGAFESYVAKGSTTTEFCTMCKTMYPTCK